MSTLDELIHDVRTWVNRVEMTSTGSGCGDIASSGEVVDRFEYALARWHGSVGVLVNQIGQFEFAFRALDRRQLKMRERLAILNAMWLEEDARQEVYTMSDISDRFLRGY